jgi:peptide-methionine (R)-S-oxide reductase
MRDAMQNAAWCGLGEVLVGLALLGAGCGKVSLAGPGRPGGDPSSGQNLANPVVAMKDKDIRTDAEWKAQLTPEQYRVLREKATERPFTGAYWNEHQPGTYRCAGCGQVLFEADTKFDSGCGWPSFSAPAATNRVDAQADDSLSMHRTEVLCSRCGGHLGHVFEDGPKPTGLRYCINSAALDFQPKPGDDPRGPAKPVPASP